MGAHESTPEDMITAHGSRTISKTEAAEIVANYVVVQARRIGRTSLDRDAIASWVSELRVTARPGTYHAAAVEIANLATVRRIALREWSQ